MEEEKRCRVCGGPVPKPRRGPTRDYCRPACRQRAYRLRVQQSRRAERQRYIRQQISQRRDGPAGSASKLDDPGQYENDVP